MTSDRRIACVQRFLALLLGAVMAYTAAPFAAADQPVSLTANYTQLARIGVGGTSGQLSFTVDASAKHLMFDIASVVADFATSIEAPGGRIVNEANVGALGGSFAKANGGGATSGPLIYPFTTPGTHYIYTLPSQGAGTYIVRFQAPSAQAEQVAVIVQMSSDSTLAAKLFFTEPVVVTGRPVVMAAAVFNGAVPVANAAVVVRVLSPTAIVAMTNLADDGGQADGAANDGLYSGFFTPPSPGTYRAVAEITGTANGVAFVRQSAATLEVVRQTGTLAGTVHDRGVDTNGNGKFEFVAFDIGVNATTAGRYRLFVTLRTQKGQTLVASGDATLVLGAQNATVDVDTGRLRALGENGPYFIDQIELRFLDGAKAIPADRRVDLGQTAAYQLTQFERAPILLTGTTSDAGVDTNGNGKFDLLRVRVEVDVLAGGTYQFSGRLTDVNGTQIDLDAASAFLAAGPNSLDFFFDGRIIGSRGISGPYFLDNLLIFGAGSSLSAPQRVARTQNYSYTQFENAARNPADLDNDGHVDCKDVAIVKASFGRRLGQPGFDARADVNHDNVVDVRDLTAVTKALPIGLRCS
jgi:hypothetical protein